MKNLDLTSDGSVWTIKVRPIILINLVIVFVCGPCATIAGLGVFLFKVKTNSQNIEQINKNISKINSRLSSIEGYMQGISDAKNNNFNERE